MYASHAGRTTPWARRRASGPRPWALFAGLWCAGVSACADRRADESGGKEIVEVGTWTTVAGTLSSTGVDWTAPATMTATTGLGSETSEGGASGTTAVDSGSTDGFDESWGDELPRFDILQIPDSPHAQRCTKADFLFVIDNSGSMSDDQAALRAAFPGFMAEIRATGILDYHVAITSTDMGNCTANSGNMGAFIHEPRSTAGGCRPLDRRYIVGPDPTDAQDFACIADLSSGSGHEQPLQAGYSALVERVLDGNNPPEFRRRDALLIVIFITDEDDQSGLIAGVDNCAEKPVDLYQRLYEEQVLRGNPTAGVFVAISGPQSSSCAGASAAPRLHDFIGRWGTNGHWSSLCDTDLSRALSEALETINVGCDSFDPEG